MGHDHASAAVALEAALVHGISGDISTTSADGGREHTHRICLHLVAVDNVPRDPR